MCVGQRAYGCFASSRARGADVVDPSETRSVLVVFFSTLLSIARDHLSSCTSIAHLLRVTDLDRTISVTRATLSTRCCRYNIIIIITYLYRYAWTRIKWKRPRERDSRCRDIDANLAPSPRYERVTLYVHLGRGLFIVFESVRGGEGARRRPAADRSRSSSHADNVMIAIIITYKTVVDHRRNNTKRNNNV
jgi:hypothetical protein